MGCGVGIEFVEVGHAHGEVSISEELDRLGLGAVGKQCRDALLDRAFLKQPGKGLGPGGTFAHDDARGIEVVVQSAALAQELGREDEVS